MAESRKQYKNVKSKPLLLSEEVGGKKIEKPNMLCRGDNKVLMRTLLEEYHMEGGIQMIYIDPPFYSKSNYDAVVKAGDENIKHMAYGDKWEKGLSEYLKMLAVRLYLMKDLLADDGLLWVHLDWHVVHYAKVILDEIFGEKHFVNEIIWNYKSGGTSKKHFARKHDTILVYAKGSKYKFYPLQEKSYNRQFKPYRFKGVKEYKDEMGWYTMVNMKDVWNIDMVGRTSAERTGYATQKPEQLLERIITSCTEEGDICADFFCGSGTLPAVASRMGRRFIACDMGSLAIESTIKRLAVQEESFHVFDLKPEGKSKIEVEVEIREEEIPSSDKRLLRLTLVSLKEKGLAKTVEKKSTDKVKQVLKEDSLQMVEGWSIDFNYTDGVHRPEVIFVRTKGTLQTSYEKIVNGRSPICVKIVDIFGNVVFERIGYERNYKTEDH